MPELTRHHRFWPKGETLGLEYPQRSLFQNLEWAAAEYPTRALIEFYGESISYRQALELVTTMAGFLQRDCGVCRGDRVILDLQNSAQFVLAYYAILRADAVVVPVNPMLKADELRHIVNDSGARTGFIAQDLLPALHGTGLEQAIVVTYGDHAGKPATAGAPDPVTDARNWHAEDLPDIRLTAWRDALARRRQPAPHASGPDDWAVLPYSSGTTGMPKGCLHPNRTFMATAVMGRHWSVSPAHPVVLSILPMFHVTGMQGGMNGPILAGATTVQMLRWDRRLAAEFIARYRVTGWTSITTMAIDFLLQPGVEQFDLSSLHRIGGGGAAMPAAVAQKWKDLTSLDYIEGYGLTETAAPTHINPVDAPKKQCAGIPIFDTDARIIDPDTLTELDVGESGEIIVNGPQVFIGYWNNPQASDDAFINIDGKRFFRTGDIGHYDDEGYFFITDRLKRMINASGFKVWPAEIEALMYGHPAVQEACVIAARDARRGETVKAVVVLNAASRGKHSAQDMLDWCREHMAAYKVPRIIEFADALPRSGTGKVMWRTLQDLERDKSD